MSQQQGYEEEMRKACLPTTNRPSRHVSRGSLHLTSPTTRRTSCSANILTGMMKEQELRFQSQPEGVGVPIGRVIAGPDNPNGIATRYYPHTAVSNRGEGSS